MNDTAKLYIRNKYFKQPLPFNVLMVLFPDGERKEVCYQW